jgi:hypothetical protein
MRFAAQGVKIRRKPQMDAAPMKDAPCGRAGPVRDMLTALTSKRFVNPRQPGAAGHGQLL